MSTDPDLVTQGVPLRGVGGSMVSGDVVRWEGSISFLGDVDPGAGTLTKDGSVFDIKDRVIVFNEGAGSTVGSYVVYNLRLKGNSPAAMVMEKADAIISIGCILAGIPLVHRVPREHLKEFLTGDRAEVDPVSGSIKLWRKRS